MTNITLAIDEKTLKAARSYAKARGTTLNALVREQLGKVLEQEQRREEARKGLIDLIEKSTARMGPGFKFNRDEMYESPMLSGHKHPDLRRRRKT